MGSVKLVNRVRNWRLLPPKEGTFYKYFDEISETLTEGSSKLIELFTAQVQDRQVIGVEIENCLTRMSRTGEQIEDLLRRAHQPPFDRSSISQFSDDSFRIMKHINHAANRYLIYYFPSSDKEMRELAPIIKEACDEIAKAVKTLPKNRVLDPYCRSIDRLETKADEIYHEGLRRRFHEIRTDRLNLETRIKANEDSTSVNEILPIISANVEYTRHTAVFFILRQVYEELERAIDACTEVAASLKRMVAENV